ncbi:MAG: Cysteine-rich secretory protein family protein [candidate division BRC1 bacterium ADurb.BinA364]|nr:MAG: Cysteine-rich secretory protein family protein [candidate division BRC1 bacterium ADurb.BinA364]
MARLGYLSHSSPTRGREQVKDRFAAEGLGWRYLAENIALEPCWARFWTDGRVEPYTWAEAARNAVEHWMQSAGHRENILSPHARQMGVGAAAAPADGRPYLYITQNFLAP